nr:uncharacterized protein LOC109235076 [Ipomoea batatas]
MWRILAVISQNLGNMGKSPRVADESMLAAAAEIPAAVIGRRRGRRVSVVVYGIFRAPLSLFSCLSRPPANGSMDGVWVTGDFAQMSEMNHLMVSDSMRYAILM